MSSDFPIFADLVTVMNPLPRVTRAVVAERAGVRDVRNPDSFDFDIECIFNGRQRGIVEPQTTLQLHAEAGKIFVSDYQDRGLLMVDPSLSEQNQRLSGLEQAAKFYNLRGNQQLGIISQNMTEDQMSKMKYDIAGLYINAAREEFVLEEIERVREGVFEPLVVGEDLGEVA